MHPSRIHLSRLFAIAAIALALVLPGCTDSHEDPTDVHRSRIDDLCSGVCNDPVALGPYVVPGAIGGGTVTVLTDHGLDGTLDPAGAADPAAVSILSGLVTRSLAQYQYDPRTHTMVLVPDLATDLGRHNDDYTKWAFTIRSGARFENGSHVTARDVVRGIRRCLHARPFPTSPGVEEGPIGSARSAHRNQVLLTFVRPFPDAPYLGATPALGPVPRGTKPVDSAYARHPAATGPYRIQDYRRGHDLVLVRNHEWDPRTDPGRTQYPERYVVRAGIPVRRIERLLTTDPVAAQTTLTFDDVRPGIFERLADVGAEPVLGPAPCTTYLSPDNRTISGPRVRRALVWAYPYRAALRAAGLVAGVTALPAKRLVPPGVPGRTRMAVPHHRAFETSARVARRMLTSAHALGTRIRFSYDPGDPASVRLREHLARALRAAGFVPRPEHQPTTLLPGQTPAGRLVDLRTTTRCGVWPSGREWLDPAYRPTHPDRTGQLFANTEAFARPAVTRRLDRIVRLPLEDQADAWNKLDEQVLRRWQPVVPLWYGGVAMVHGSRVEGMADDSVRGMPTWSRIWVSPGS